MVLSMETRITLEKFCGDMRDIFKFDEDDDFTLKWLDEEGQWSERDAYTVCRYGRSSPRNLPSRVCKLY